MQTVYEYPFPIIIQRTRTDNSNLNKELEVLVKKIIKEKQDVTSQNYIATEGAKQADCNILIDYYGKEDCITQLVDNVINPCVRDWAAKHFKKLLGSSDMISPQFRMTSWATIYGPSSWQTPHIHRDKMLTGVYYFKMNDTVSNYTNNAECTNDVHVQPPDMRAEGSLVLQNPHLQSTQPLLGGWQTHKEFLPQEGELIIMPSWISHFPKPFSKGERGCIVFDGEFLGL